MRQYLKTSTDWSKSRYTEVAILYTTYCILPTFGPLCILDGVFFLLVDFPGV